MNKIVSLKNGTTIEIIEIKSSDVPEVVESIEAKSSDVPEIVELTETESASTELEDNAN